MTIDRILSAIGSTEESDFSEFCRGLGDDCPRAGNIAGWRGVWQALEDAEVAGLVTVNRLKGRYVSAILTKAGADRIREQLDSKRPLLGLL